MIDELKPLSRKKMTAEEATAIIREVEMGGDYADAAMDAIGESAGWSLEKLLRTMGFKARDARKFASEMDATYCAQVK